MTDEASSSAVPPRDAVDRVEWLVKEQLRIMEKQLQLMRSLQGVATAPTPANEAWPLSDLQADVWVNCQLSSAGSAAYDLSSMLRLQGDLHVESLHEALRRLVQRHESLRTTFDAAGEHQIVHATSALELPLIDLTESNPDERDRAIAAFLDDEVSSAYDLVHGPLFRATLIRRGPSDHLLILSGHHLVCDGWSFGVLKRELGALYTSLVSGVDVPLGEPGRYQDYSAWRTDLGAESEPYWLDLYREPPAPLELPTDKARPPERSFAYGSVRSVIDGSLLGAVKGLAAAEGVTPFVVLLAAWEILLHRLSGQASFSSGVFVSGQTSMGVRDLTGLCANLLPLRVSVRADERVSDYLQRSKQTTYDAIDNQHYTVGALARALQLPRDASRPMVVSTVITYETPTQDLDFAGLVVDEPVHGRRRFGSFDFEAYLTESAHDLTVDFDFSTDLFEPATIARWQRYYATLLRAMSTDPTVAVAELQLLDEAERRELLETWNETAHPYPDQAVVHELFDAQAEATPERTALLFEGEPLSFALLQRRSNRLAHLLLARGVTVGTAVGVVLPRSPDAIVAMLAIMKAGGAYLPLDPDHPAERLAMMIEDAGVTLVLSGSGVADLPATLVETLEVVGFDDPAWPSGSPQTAVTPDDAFFITFTSGSTGRPKGVQGTHRGMVNRFDWQWRTYPFSEGEVCCQKTSFNFVDHLWETWGPLLKGHTLVIASDEDVKDGRRFVDLLAEHRVERLVAVPSYLNALVRSIPDVGARLRGLRYCTLSGERLTNELAAELRALLPDTVLLNFYGMSEASGDATWFDSRWPTQSGSVPIGRPIQNTRIYLLDHARRPVPPGATGEIHVGGVGLAKGYCGRPELTAERFLPDPFVDEPGARMYRSGDLARWLPDGMLEFVGRVDQQVKIRGIRVELGEVEAAARSLPEVESAVVSARPIGDERQLVAYVVLADGAEARPADLRAALASKLPDYMVPARVITLDAFPLTATGKLDPTALPDPGAERPASDVPYVRPRTLLEGQLAEIWQELLGVERVGIHDGFFDLGGDSLLALRCVMRANRAGMNLAPISLFRHQTIAELAAAAEAAGSAGADGDVASGPAPLTPGQLRFLTERVSPAPHHWNLSELVSTERLQPAALRTAVAAVVEHHDALRLRLWQESGSWVQEIALPTGEVPLESHDLSGLASAERTEAIERACTELQQGFDLARGPLLRVAHFSCGPGERDRLFVTLHHFAIDGMSWGVLWEDLEHAYRQAAGGEAVSLPPRTASFRRWAAQLEQLAHSARVIDTADAWLALPWDKVGTLPLDFEASPRHNSNASAAAVALELSAEDTRRLLDGGRRPEHVIITALARALSTWTASSTVLIDVLSHGRDAALEGINLSRTVAFTLSYNPLVLHLPTWATGPDLLDEVSRQIEAGPEGFSFELLRFLAPNEALREALGRLPRAELLFNYAGAEAGRREDVSWLAATEPIGPEEAPDGLRQHPIAVRAALAPNLRLTFVYSRALHSAATVEAKVAEVATAIHGLLAGAPVAS